MKGKLSFSRNDMLAGISIRTNLIDGFVAAFLEENPGGFLSTWAVDSIPVSSV